MSSIAIFGLAWRSPATTERSLESWRALEHPLVAERYLWYQEVSAADQRQAERFGFTALGTSANVGIGSAYRACLEVCTSEYALFLECDWRLTGRDPIPHLRHAVELVAGGQADLVRLRSRLRPGWPLNTIPARGRELDHPAWLLESCYWRRRPDRSLPDLVRTLRVGGEVWYLADAAHASWTNNPHLARTDFLRGVADRAAATGPELEPAVNAWWGAEDLVVAQGRGLFTHDRVDGPSGRSTLKRRVVLDAKRALPVWAYQVLRRRAHPG